MLVADTVVEGDLNDEVLPVHGKANSVSFTDGRENGFSGSLFATRFNFSKVCGAILSACLLGAVPLYPLPYSAPLVCGAVRGGVRCLADLTASFDEVQSPNHSAIRVKSTAYSMGRAVCLLVK